ncbi:hypothetical protein FAZ69_26280 [Trinickia terrae]|uniref:Uncharacterized protein n=1 Tax=Trinickia terrae TaxID=2571161 RepID=A0A4U1HQL2_9BURK|nr:hypothetical protein [Trinickia terrae]TKC82593.1 hypothetical protein FAZ69_26280 [Trinickia terrae]
MKKKISIYWPLAVIVPLAAVAYLHAYGDAATHAPLAARQVTAELARTVSYGYITDGGTAKELPVVRRGAPFGASEAS